MTLETPIKRVAGAPVDEVTTLRMWRGISRRRLRASSSPTRRNVLFPVAVACALTLVLGLVRPALHHDSGPLRLAGGNDLTILVGDASGRELVVALDDGSTIALAIDARLRALANTSSAVVALLETGRATFDVKPGGPRLWTIECGLAAVEVIGTRFTIDRVPHRLKVSVERGAVLVRGPLVKDRIARLTAGEALELDEPEAEGSAAKPDTTAPSTTTAKPSDSATADPTAKAPERREAPVSMGDAPKPPAVDDVGARWRALARKGAHREAYAAIAPSGGVAHEAQGATVEDLLLLADVARLSGHPAEAVGPLQRVIREHRGAQASVAAFTLGRIQLDSLGQAAAAAQTFAEAIALGLPQGLRESAFARIVEARARAGDRAGAKAAAEDYEARYPSGGRLAEVRAWAGRNE
jgi:transmembrane sensor